MRRSHAGATTGSRLLTIVAGTLAWLALSATVAVGLPGDIDPTFGVDGWVSIPIDLRGHLWIQPDALVDPDGAVLIAGGSIGRITVWRFTPQGAPDRTFGVNGAVTLETPARGMAGAIARLPDGKLLIGGISFGRPVIIGLLPDGSLDPSFGEKGVTVLPFKRLGFVTDLALDPDGSIVVGGQHRAHSRMVGFMARLTAGGQLDRAFARKGIFGMAWPLGGLDVTSAGLIIAATHYPGTREVLIMGINRFGFGEDNFGEFGALILTLSRPVTSVGSLDLGPDDAAIISVATRSPRCLMDGGQVIKLTEGGGLDRGFGNQGVVTWRCNKVNSASVDADGRVLVAGTSFTGGGSGDNNAFVARLDPDGRFDSGFGLDGQAVLHRSDTYYLDGVEALAQGVGVIAFGQNWTHDEKHLDLVRLFG